MYSISDEGHKTGINRVKGFKTMFTKRHEIMQEAAPVVRTIAVRPEQDKAPCGLVP